MKEKQRIYSYRKFKGIGLASAVVGMAVFGVYDGVTPVQAESVTEHSDNSKLEDKPDKVVLKEGNPTNNLVSEETQPINTTDSESSERTDHGQLVETDDQSMFGWIGELYEDGTYVMKGVPGKNIALLNPNNGVSSMFGADMDKISKIKQFILDSGSIDDFHLPFWNGVKSHMTSIELKNIQLNSRIPYLTGNDEFDSLSEFKIDSTFTLSSISELTPMFNSAINLKLTNEQVSQLLRNVAFDSKKGYSGPLWRKVGVERLDLSSFDNSKWNSQNYQPYTFWVGDKQFNTKSVFKDLIGLKEVVFGDKFDFEKYASKNTTDAFMDTDLSGVEKVTFAGNKPSNDKFVKDWLGDVQKLNDTNKQGLYRDGQYVGSVTDALNATEKTYEDGVYTLGPISTPRPEKPADKVSTEVIEPVVEYVGDTNQSPGYESRAEGSKGSKTVTTTYEWDDATNSYKEKVLEPFIKEAGKTVVTVGTKPKVVTEVLEPAVVYEKDDTREFGAPNQTTTGSKGSKVTTTTYTVDKNTGKVTEHVGEPVITAAGVSRVAVAAKTKVVQSKDAQGRNVIETTTYTVDKDTGNVTPTTVKTYGTTKEPTVEKRVVEPAVVYEADKTREYGASNDRVEGQAGEETVTTTYTVDPNTGEIKPVVGEPVLTKKPTNTVVKVAAKDKVVTEVLEPTVVYEKDDTREFGAPNQTTAGSKGSKVITTTYTVDKNTGKVTEHVGEPVITNAGVSTVTVATKPTVVQSKDAQGRNVIETTTYTVDKDTGNVTPTTVRTYGTTKEPTVEKRVVEPAVVYEADKTREYGASNEQVEGQAGEETVTTTYTVDSNSGEIKSVVGQPVRTKEPINTVVKVAAKDKVVTEVLEPTVVYEKDDTREFGTENHTTVGSRGSKVITTTYTVDKNTGKVTETVGEPVITKAGVSKVAIATKPTVMVLKTDGKMIQRTTTYSVNHDTGEITSHMDEKLISDNGGTIPAPTVEIPEYTKPIGGAGLDGQGNTIPAPTVEIPEYIDSEQPQTLKPVLPAPSVDKPMFNGPIEPSVERKVIPAGKRYEKDDSREKGQPDQVIKGKDGSIVTTTTFTVDKDGNVLATNSEPVRDEPVAEVIKVAAKDKVETKVVESPKRYVGDNTKELGYESGVFGKDGEVHIRTIYDVNPETGEITERTEKELSIVPTETVITKGMKPSVKTVERDGKVYEQTTTYTVNEKTGELSSSTTEKFIKDVENPVVNPVDKPEVEPVVEQTEQKQLPNTGDAGTLASLAGLGIGLLGAGLARKREE